MPHIIFCGENMKTLSCAFFGHRDYQYWGYRDKLEKAIRYLIDIGVTEFYSGNRGVFDRMCAHTVCELKGEYPQIKNILVLSYLPDTWKLPEWYDDAVYLVDKKVPPRFAILYTNKILAQTADYIIVGVDHKYGGAWSVYQYAKKHYYSTLNIINDENHFFYEVVSPTDAEKITEEYKEEAKAFYLKTKDQVENDIVKYAKKTRKRRQKEYEPPAWISVIEKKETTDF